MTSEQSGTTPAIAIPPWIEASLFQNVLQQIATGYRQTKNFKITPALNPGENYCSEVLRIEAEVELKDGSSKTVSLMLKTAHDDEMTREMMKNHNLFEVEATMYREVVPEFEELYRQVGVDVNFGARSYELPIDKPYILLDDLKPKGFENANRLEGLDMEHTQAVLTKLAQWHAASVVRITTKGPFKSIICENFYREKSREMMQNIFQGMTKAFLDCAKTYEGNDVYYKRLWEMKDVRLDEMFETNKIDPAEFNVLNHGDCWSNNVMFRHDARGKLQETYLIDFQIPKYGSPAQDLYYFLLSSTRYELKLNRFEDFIKFYYDQLIGHLKLLNYSGKMPALKDYLAYNTSTGVMAAALLDPNNNASLDNFLGDSDIGTEFKMQLYSNPRYRKHIEMVLPWLHNRGAL